MKVRKLGHTGIEVSEIGFGGLAIGGTSSGNSYGQVEEKKSRDAIHAAIESGCNFFNTADIFGYGTSERLIGNEILSRRSKIVLCTHNGDDFYHGYIQKNFSPSYLREALLRSLDRLQTDYIDVYLLNFPSLQMIRDGGVFELLENLKREEIIRAGGVAVNTVEEARAALKIDTVEVLELSYNLLNRNISRIFPAIRVKGCGLIIREPLYHGYLSGKFTNGHYFPRNDMRSRWSVPEKEKVIAYVNELLKLQGSLKVSAVQLALQFVLHNTVVSSVVTGCKTPEQIIENILAADIRSLSDADFARLPALGN